MDFDRVLEFYLVMFLMIFLTVIAPLGFAIWYFTEPWGSFCLFSRCLEL
jgi:hypothetical protein